MGKTGASVGTVPIAQLSSVRKSFPTGTRRIAHAEYWRYGVEIKDVHQLEVFHLQEKIVNFI
jgi:hypothetical protein